MGLDLEVGYLADMLSADEDGAQSFRENLARLNTYLQSCGLPPHREAEDCPVHSARVGGYGSLHYLRRLAAHLDLRGALPPPFPRDSDPAADPVLGEYYARTDGVVRQPSFLARLFGRKAPPPPPSPPRRFDHLILHSDAEGYYVPQDFPAVLIPPEELGIPGAALGSSQRLLAETTRLAEALELPPDLNPESDAVEAACENPGEGAQLWQRYGTESYVCLTLLHAARHSVKHSALIIFC